MRRSDQKYWELSAHIVLIIMSFLAIMPFVLLLIASFTDDKVALLQGYSYLPKKLSLAAYGYIWNEAQTILRAYGITITITVIGTLVGMMITTMLAFMLSREGLPGRKVLNFLLIFTMLFNGGLVPQYILYSSTFHIKDTLFALIVPNLLMNAFNVILVKNYFQYSLPTELFEAARIDGASEFTVFKIIALPLSKPILATVGMMTAISYWNDWQNGMYYLNNTKLFSIQSILNAINNSVQFLATNSIEGVRMDEIPSTTVRMAICVVGVIPIIIAYPFFQKYFVKGITMGAVKG
ncbi:MAG TPA: carbohydrate ABC transporter permease [Clostridiales bacterium]|nr:carbohydrate ABC transporter permease [Clostridiales bacterium]